MSIDEWWLHSTHRVSRLSSKDTKILSHSLTYTILYYMMNDEYTIEICDYKAQCREGLHIFTNE